MKVIATLRLFFVAHAAIGQDPFLNNFVQMNRHLMFKIFLLLLGGLPLMANAQNNISRALALPEISGMEFADEVPAPIVSDDGKRLLFPPNRVVSPSEAKSTDRNFYVPTDAFRLVIPARLYSPDLQQTVYNFRAIVTAEGGKRRRFDWISLGFGPEGGSEKFRFDEKDYVLAVMNDGKLVVTDAVSIDYNATDKWSVATGISVKKMIGLSLLDPVSGMRRQITKDVLIGKENFNAGAAVSGDSKKLLVSRSVSGQTDAEILVYDLESGNKQRFTWPIYHFQRGMGTKMVLVEQAGEFGNLDKKAVKVMQLSDGAMLINQPLSNEYGIEQYYLAPNDDLHHYDPEKATISTFRESGGEFLMTARVVLDTAGLGLARTKYHFKVMEKYIALFPRYVPANYPKPYPVFGYFFDRSTGKPLLAVRPLFKQPETPPTAEQIAVSKRLKCEYLNKVVPFKTGSLLRNKLTTNGCERPAYIFSGIDCDKGTYLLTNLGGSVYPLPDILAGDYEVCVAGNFMPCKQCDGIHCQR